MSLLALTSAKGSPGVTTAALALATVWPRRVVVAECDPAGGDIVAGYLQAHTAASDGLLALAMGLRRGRADLDAHAVALDPDGRRLLLPGLRDPAQAATVTPLWPRLADVFAGLDTAELPTDVLADCGRLDPVGSSDALLARADLVLLVLWPTLPAVAAAQPRVAALRRRLAEGTGSVDGLGLLLVGDAPYRPAEVAGALGVPVLATLAADPAAARVLAGEAAADRRFARSALLRTAHTAAERLDARISERRRALRTSAVPESADAQPVRAAAR